MTLTKYRTLPGRSPRFSALLQVKVGDRMIVLDTRNRRSHEPPRNSGEGTAVDGPMPLGEKDEADAPA